MEEKHVLPQPDILAWPLEAAERKLKESGCIYTIEETIAPKHNSQNFQPYVVRQLLKENGVHSLTICRKLGKEVF